MDKYGISRCFMFCLDEPDRHPGFQAGNDRTLAFGERSNGRMIPFVRLDLAEDPIGEATRMLDRGAKGIKLHPRAQKFLLNDERLSPIFELAADRKVPILIHGGRGLPPIADDLGSRGRSQSGRAAHRRARGHRRPGGARRSARRQGGRLLRHVGLEPARPARPLPPRRARAGPLCVGLPLRAAARFAADLTAHRAARAAERRAGSRGARRQRRSHRGR